MISELPIKFSRLAIVTGLLALGACSTVDDLIPDDLMGTDTVSEESKSETPDALIETPPVFSTGDSYSFNNPDMTWSVIDIKANKISWRNNSGDLQTTDNNPLLPALEWKSEKRGEGRRIISNMQGSFFPLEVGNQVMFKTTVNTDKPPYAWEFDWTCDFVSRQNITVPAGSFDTFRVDCYRQKPELWSFYYAPKIGYYVKMDSNSASSPADIKIRELVNFAHDDQSGGAMSNMTVSESTVETNAADTMAVETQTVEQIPAPVVITVAPTSEIIEPAAPVAPEPMVAPASFTGYGMHVESYKNSKNIDAAWERLIKKYPNQLAGFQKIIKRVDLGSKGVFDRLIIGPLDSQKNAEDFCRELKVLGQKYCQAVKL